MERRAASRAHHCQRRGACYDHNIVRPGARSEGLDRGERSSHAPHSSGRCKLTLQRAAAALRRVLLSTLVCCRPTVEVHPATHAWPTPMRLRMYSCMVYYTSIT